MAANLRRMVVLGPSGTIQPGSSHDYRVLGNRGFFAQTGTRWVRMWADWPTLMPDAAGFDPAIIGSLDEQIALARRDGLRIVLTLYRFATWANGTDAMTPAQLRAAPPDCPRRGSARRCPPARRRRRRRALRRSTCAIRTAPRRTARGATSSTGSRAAIAAATRRGRRWTRRSTRSR